MAPAPNFVVSVAKLNHNKLWCTYRIWQDFSKIAQKSFENNVTASYDVIFCLRLRILWNLELLYFWTDLAEIYLSGQTPSADSESEVIFYIRGQYQADIGHFLQFCLKIVPGTTKDSLQHSTSTKGYWFRVYDTFINIFGMWLLVQ